MQPAPCAFRFRTVISLIVLGLIPFEIAHGATPATAQAGWRTYDSTADGPRPDLKSHFVAFSFRYPETFKLREHQDGIYAVVTKYGPNGTDEMASFTVSWYESDEPNSNKGNAEGLASLGTQWAEKMSDFNSKTVSYSMLKIDGVLADGATWEFTTRDAHPVFAAAAKSYFVHQPGTTKGVRIDLYGTYFDPKLKSARSLGDSDDLSRILATFKFLSDKNESASKPAATTTPSDAENRSPEDQQALGNAALKWLTLLDAGNYAETFATASESFRKGLTLEEWKKNHAAMQKQFGPIKDRNGNASISTTTTQSEDGKETVSYALKINTTFAKATGVETITMTKESGAWKVADYSIETKR